MPWVYKLGQIPMKRHPNYRNVVMDTKPKTENFGRNFRPVHNNKQQNIYHGFRRNA